MKYILLPLLFMCFVFSTAQSQVIEVPLNENLVLKQHHARFGDQKSKYLEKNGSNNTLPFLEDFTTPGPFPNPLIWEDNQAYINNGMGQMPPSYGVATFEGLDASGQPYGGGYGGSDTLTSRAFDLSGFSSSDDIYISYFIQARGLGEKPDAADFLILEFLDNSGNWVNIEQHAGLSGVPPDFIPDFSQHFHAVTSNSYLHSNFKFRFRNFSSNSGYIDHWNLDYIEMDANRSANETSANDIANVTTPPDILRTYASMPFDQFLADIPGELQLSAAMQVTNHFDTGKDINPRNIKATEMISGSQILPVNNLGQVNFASGQTLDLDDQLSFNDFDFGSLPSSLDNATIVTEYSYQSSGQSLEALCNDTARTTTYFRNYYAYDDGTAESNITAFGQGTQVAVKFHANVEDTIQAIQLHIQHLQGSVENQQFNLFVWIDNLEEDPVTDLIFESPSYVDTINGFTQYNLEEPVFLESGDDFFIGWQQFTQTSSPIPIGFDKNNPEASQFNFKNENDGAGWVSLGPSLTGAIMIRPLMGFELFVSNENLVVTENYLDIFPNPASETVNIRLIQGNYADYSFELYDALGRMVSNGILREQLQVKSLSEGLHFIKITHLPSNKVMHHKLIKINK